MYQLIIAPRAKKQLKRLARVYKRSVRSALMDVKENPRIGKPLERELTGQYSYRIGVYRILYKIDEQSKIVNVLLVGHRSRIYQ